MPAERRDHRVIDSERVCDAIAETTSAAVVDRVGPILDRFGVFASRTGASGAGKVPGTDGPVRSGNVSAGWPGPVMLRGLALAPPNPVNDPL